MPSPSIPQHLSADYEALKQRERVLTSMLQCLIDAYPEWEDAPIWQRANRVLRGDYSGSVDGNPD